MGKWLRMLYTENKFCSEVNIHMLITVIKWDEWFGQNYSSKQIAIVLFFFGLWDIESLEPGQ